MIDAAGRFAAGRRAAPFLAAWAAVEAIVLPIVPDVGLALLVLARPGRGLALFGAVVAGAVLGSLAMWGFASSDPAAIERLLLAVPGIDAAMLGDVDRRIANDGLAAFGQVGPGAPLKAWTAGWAEAGGGVLEAAVGAGFNRVTRIGPVVAAAWLAGHVAGPWLDRHGTLVVAAYAAAWIAVYALFVL